MIGSLQHYFGKRERMTYRFPYVFFMSFVMLMQCVYGQSIVTSVPQLDFGNVFENAPSTLMLDITNNSDQAVRVIDIQFFDTYGFPAFYVEESEFDLATNGTKSIAITFHPLHNIEHNTEMFIVTEHRGAFAVDLIGKGKYSNTYYNQTENLEQEALKDKLTQIVSSGTNDLGYNDARTEMYMELDNQKENGQGANVNTIEGVYTGTIRTGYQTRQELQNMGFNCEHTWPQSKGAGSSPMRSDIHHLFPTLGSANSTRGSDAFAVVANASWFEGGSKSNGNRFEPRDKQKGITARAMFYFATRYQNTSGIDWSWFDGQEDILRQWSSDFPPSDAEIARNAGIHDLQNNRNPYVDYPQFMERISDFTSNASATNSEKLVLSQEWIDFGFVTDNEPVTYAYGVYNDGNTPIELSDFELDNTNNLNLSIPTDTMVTLQPGEDFSFELSLTSPSDMTIENNLNFDSNIAGQANITVPIVANSTVGFEANLEPKWAETVEIYPNPAHKYLNIQLSMAAPKAIDILVYDISGQIVIESSFKNAFHSLPLNQLRNGIYWLLLKSEEQSVVKTFIVQM